MVVNRYERGTHFGLEDVEKSTLARVVRTIPNSPLAVSDSINQGVPLVELTPRDPVARVLREWAENLAPLDGNGHTNGSKNGNGNGNGGSHSNGGPIGLLRRFMGFGQ